MNDTTQPTSPAAEAERDYWNDFHEGQRFEPWLTTVTQADSDALNACVNLTRITGPDGQELAEASGRERCVSPFLLNTFLPMRGLVRMPDGLLHARETLRMHNGAQVGDTLSTVMTVLAKYEKNNRHFLEFRHVVTRASDGAPIMTFDRTIAWVNK